ncbi:tRNA-dihydrouridine synthase [Tribonema minus]|uniref:tRNA-dihydrouridine synthase n=1 Tax=Tribonema minus TaxID=303371 RepID=A0A836CCW1_9STRA|nr:tRNA-dihydrouridine synthase [Tribonema minus]
MGLSRHDQRLSLAPMMEYTDRHMRYMLRLYTKKMVMWTEMIPIGSIVHNADDLDRILGYDQSCEHPVVLQLGGSDPELVRTACELARPYQYDQINLNVGCPSERVAGKGAFGAALMREPRLVADICAAMREGSGGAQTSVKCRIGVDDEDSYASLARFVDVVARGGGVSDFIVHARKAILKGLSPEQNRKVPPLKYDYVYRLVRDFPELSFTLNGGVTTYAGVQEALDGGAHGVMVGRAVLERPWYWSQSDSRVFGATDAALNRRQVLQTYFEYAEGVEAEAGARWLTYRRRLLKPVWNLFHGEPGGKKFRARLDGMITQERPFHAIINDALQELPPDVVDAPPGVGRTFKDLKRTKVAPPQLEYQCL